MSFSTEVKREAAALPMKKTCCRRALIAGALVGGGKCCDDEIALQLDNTAAAELCAHLVREQFGREAEPQPIGKRGFLLTFVSKSAAALLQDSAANPQTLIRCPECAAAFVRGAFLGGGTISAPRNYYHLELGSRAAVDMTPLAALAAENGIALKPSMRLGKPTLYSKDSGAIEDFLFFIGAGKQAFDFVNAKIGREIKNDINRRTNCETGNIARSTASAARHLAAIRLLDAHGRLSELGPELEYTARMRLENPEISLAQLGQMMTPTVSKPGLYHRLEKICTAADALGLQSREETKEEN